MSLLEAYAAGRRGYLQGLRNPHRWMGATRALHAAWECGWMDARREGGFVVRGKEAPGAQTTK